ncbi:hypothetical protein [Mycobacterium uberis]|nr:hypothetical protein [Mycobacterium uberis]
MEGPLSELLTDTGEWMVYAGRAARSAPSDVTIDASTKVVISPVALLAMA